MKTIKYDKDGNIIGITSINYIPIIPDSRKQLLRELLNQRASNDDDLNIH